MYRVVFYCIVLYCIECIYKCCTFKLLKTIQFLLLWETAQFKHYGKISTKLVLKQSSEKCMTIDIKNSNISNRHKYIIERHDCQEWQANKLNSVRITCFVLWKTNSLFMPRTRLIVADAALKNLCFESSGVITFMIFVSNSIRKGGGRWDSFHLRL